MRELALVAGSLALGFTPAARAADGANDAASPSVYEQAVEAGPSAVHVRLRYDAAAPGSTALAGEGSIDTTLPGEGHLTLRIPYAVGQGSTVGAAELDAAYVVTHETHGLPNLGVAALVDLPTAPGTRGAHPGVKARAEKRLDTGALASLHVETELRTEGPDLNPSYRAAIGTSLRLGAATSGSLDFIEQPGLRLEARSPREMPLAQLGLRHKLDASTGLRIGFSRGLESDAGSLRATIGIDRHF
jgi:hypothetical protein